MCYKYMWDNLVAGNFAPEQFYEYFGLNPQHTVCKDLRVPGADSALVSQEDRINVPFHSHSLH